MCNFLGLVPESTQAPFAPDTPSPDDNDLAGDIDNVGMKWKIVNANNIVEYDAN